MPNCRELEEGKYAAENFMYFELQQANLVKQHTHYKIRHEIRFTFAFNWRKFVKKQNLSNKPEINIYYVTSTTNKHIWNGHLYLRKPQCVCMSVRICVKNKTCIWSCMCKMVSNNTKKVKVKKKKKVIGNEQHWHRFDFLHVPFILWKEEKMRKKIVSIDTHKILIKKIKQTNWTFIFYNHKQQ